MPDQRLSAHSPAAAPGSQSEQVRQMFHLSNPAQPVLLKIADIKRDPRAQSRVRLDLATVEEYAQDMKKGDQFPPGVVFFDGQDDWLAAGWTRTAAAESIGRPEYEYIRRSGTLRDAVLFSLAENAAHGLRRTNEDKRKAVMTMLEDDEWQTKSSEFIADVCKVSHTFVNNIRRSLATVASQGEQGGKIAQTRIGADGREYNVGRIQKKAQQRATKSTSKSPVRSFVPEGDPAPVDAGADLPDKLGDMRPAMPTGRFGLTGPTLAAGFSIPEASTTRYVSDGAIVRANSMEIVIVASPEMHQALMRHYRDAQSEGKIRITVEVVE